MNKTIGETSSFLLRFTQKIFSDETGESQVQWRGNVRYVQDGEELKFSELQDAIQFIQKKLTEQTERAVEDQPGEQKSTILEKSFSLWKRLAEAQAKIVTETIKDPKAPIKYIQEGMSQVGEKIEHDIKAWKPATQSDFSVLLEKMDSLQNQMKEMDEKINQLSAS